MLAGDLIDEALADAERRENVLDVAWLNTYERGQEGGWQKHGDET